MKIFIAANSLLPAYGGPAYSVSRLASALAQIGVEVALWAPDGSAPITPLLLPNRYVRMLAGNASDALRAFGPDVLHDNGIWMSHHHRFARLAAAHRIPRVVSIRGMLEPWALQHKRLKKKIAWGLYQRRDLELAARHHATAEAEASNVQGLRLGVPVCVIPNGVDIPAPDLGGMRVHTSRLEHRTALFLGRIYPVKGLPMLIQAWSTVRPQGWRLQIAGPDEAGHRREVEREVSKAGLDHAVSFLGPLEGSAKRAALQSAALFVLPTHSENFGMAIGEALAHGIPVLTTKGAPWPELEARSCGWWVESTTDGIASGLRRATSADAATLATMGARGRTYVAETFGWEGVARAFASLYMSVSTVPEPLA